MGKRQRQGLVVWEAAREARVDWTGDGSVLRFPLLCDRAT
jgi:hypothetical protein